MRRRSSLSNRRVLDGDDSSGEVFHQCDLLVGERPNSRTGQSHDAHCNTLAKHRNSEYRAETTEPLPFLPCEIGISQDVENVDHLALE